MRQGWTTLIQSSQFITMRLLLRTNPWWSVAIPLIHLCFVHCMLIYSSFVWNCPSQQQHGLPCYTFLEELSPSIPTPSHPSLPSPYDLATPRYVTSLHWGTFDIVLIVITCLGMPPLQPSPPIISAKPIFYTSSLLGLLCRTTTFAFILFFSFCFATLTIHFNAWSRDLSHRQSPASQASHSKYFGWWQHEHRLFW